MPNSVKREPNVSLEEIKMLFFCILPERQGHKQELYSVSGTLRESEDFTFYRASQGVVLYLYVKGDKMLSPGESVSLLVCRSPCLRGVLGSVTQDTPGAACASASGGAGGETPGGLPWRSWVVRQIYIFIRRLPALP